MGMVVFINGRFVDEREAAVSVFDRGFLYGDGLFETLRVFRGVPFRWVGHFQRLIRGAEFLGIKVPFTSQDLLKSVEELVSLNEMPESLLRITLSRGPGLRGYSPKGADHPTVVMNLHAASAPLEDPVPLQLVIAAYRLPAGEPLAQFKTCNKLPQILARAQADSAGAGEALLLNTDGYIVEGSSSNLFWIEENRVCTPPLAAGVLPGVTRGVIVELCRALEIGVAEASILPERLPQAQGVFLSLSSLGIAEGMSLDGKPLKQSALIRRIHRAYWDLVATESNAQKALT